jgi:hypothetical protein
MIVGAPWTVDWRNENENSRYADRHIAYGDGAALLNLESASDWREYQGVVASHPVIYGYYDDLQRTVMHDAGFGSTLPWPLHGQQGIIKDIDLIEIAEEAGFDVGGHLASEPSPRMVFANPPSYSEQTDPIPAIGYP